MSNKYANLVGSNKIKDEYTKINTGFDRVETDIKAVNTRVDTIITTPIEGAAAAQEIVDARVSAVKEKTFATLDARFEETEQDIATLDARFEETEQDIATHKAENATETVRGHVELATAAETMTGTNNTKAVHSAGVMAVANNIIRNKNLLHNWDWRNPVNQRGVSGEKSTTGYSIDRWNLYSGTITVNNGYITLGITSRLLHYFETLLLDGQTVTFSYLDGEGEVHFTSGTMRITIGTTDYPIDGGDIRLGKNATGHYVTFIPSSDIDVYAVKLELGDKSTLINDPPADYGEQLLLCQRYYQLHTTNDIADMDLRPSMRITPTKTAITGGYAYSADL